VACEVLGDRLFDRLELVIGRGGVGEVAPVAPRERASVDAVLFVDQPGERREARDSRFAASQPERDPTVLARPDLARAADVGAAPRAAVTRLGERCDSDHVGDEDDLLHRDVDAVGEPRRQRREDRERGLGAHVRVARRLAAPHGRPVGITGGIHVAARSHHAEVRRPPAGVRAGAAERRDAGPDRVGRARRVEVERAGEPGRVDHRVGGRKQLVEAGVVGPVDGDARLARAPRQEAVRNGAQRVAARRLDEHHLGAQVGEDASRHRRRLAGEIGDAHAGQQRFRHGHTTSKSSARTST
jgi:hypothetical protein